uniref:Uncharacterized protein n=1 Tax=Arundo donax TaxID=35708 RepID=A0A0A9ER68_ARUDO
MKHGNCSDCHIHNKLR